MQIEDVLAFLRSEEIWRALANVWPVPVGMIFLCFYGRSHFNTPQYSLELSNGGPVTRLLAAAQPAGDCKHFVGSS